MVLWGIIFPYIFYTLLDQVRTYFVKAYKHSSTDNKVITEATVRPTCRPDAVVIYEAGMDGDQR